MFPLRPGIKRKTPDALTARQNFQKEVGAAIDAARGHRVHAVDLANDLETLASNLRFELACLPRQA